MRFLEPDAGIAHFHIVFVSSLASLYPHTAQSDVCCFQAFSSGLLNSIGGMNSNQRMFSVLSLCPGGLPTTAEAMNGIIAQGFWGNATTNRLEAVAYNTITRALRGQKALCSRSCKQDIQRFRQAYPSGTCGKSFYTEGGAKAQKKWLAT